MKSASAALIAATLTLAPLSAAQAQLVDHGSTTLDTQAGLEWLDLSASTGLSFAQVSAGFDTGGAFEGYRYATSTEVQHLLGEFGLPTTASTTYSTSLAPQLAVFDSYLGLNFGGLGPAYGFQAMVGDAIDGFAGYHPLFYGPLFVEHRPRRRVVRRGRRPARRYVRRGHDRLFRDRIRTRPRALPGARRGIAGTRAVDLGTAGCRARAHRSPGTRQASRLTPPFPPRAPTAISSPRSPAPPH